jgi:ribosomal protein L40E
VCNNAGTGTSTMICPDGCANDNCVKGIAFGNKCTRGGTPCAKGGNCVEGFCCASSVTSCDINVCMRCGSSGACDAQLCKQPFECHGGGNCFRICDFKPGDPVSTCPNDPPGMPGANCDVDNFCEPFICQPGVTCR